MAIYWLDPHISTTGGTGTFASPYSIASATRAAFSPGDELRVKSVLLTNLLTATVYTATATDYYRITITAGGGLGGDFAVGDYVYFPDYDTFARVGAKSTNLLTLQVNAYMVLPITTTAAITNLTVRKFNAATYGVSLTASTGYFLATNTVDNVTVTDGWIDETTRVTDGTAKTIVRSSTTSTTVNYYIEGNVTARNGSIGLNFDLSNTYFLPHPATSPSVYVNIRSSNATYNIGFIGSQSTNGSGIGIGSTTYNVQNTTISIKSFTNYYGIPQVYGENITLNIENFYSGLMYFTFGYTALQSALGLTINITNLITNGSSQAALIEAYNVADTTINFNGRASNYSGNQINYLFHGYGNMKMNFDPSFSYSYNREASLDTALISRATLFASSTQTDKVIIPEINLPTGWTVSGNNYNTTSTFSNVYNATLIEKKAPQVYQIQYPSGSASPPQGYTNRFNVLVTHLDGTDPYEILGIGGNGYVGTTTASSFPIVRRDTVTYRTTGPSLKCNLNSRSSALWSNNSTAVKSIKIPVTAGVSRTVTGYIRTDISTYANNDCTMSVDFQQTSLANTGITTGCINNWEQFTLTFTPTQTGEAKLLWEMYYTATGNFWLDDLTVT